ncbi:TetR/AcrR family transcriptional regulator [Dactylosporangium cerinum]
MSRTERPVIGRPRSFNPDQALERALEVFWRQGYEGASLADLTEAMGINRTSMYAAFGNKEDLFRMALARYTSGPASYVQNGLQEPTARGVAEYILNGAVNATTTPDHPAGCLGVQGALATGTPAGLPGMPWSNGAATARTPSATASSEHGPKATCRRTPTRLPSPVTSPPSPTASPCRPPPASPARHSARSSTSPWQAGRPGTNPHRCRKAEPRTRSGKGPGRGAGGGQAPGDGG